MNSRLDFTDLEEALRQQTADGMSEDLQRPEPELMASQIDPSIEQARRQRDEDIANSFVAQGIAQVGAGLAGQTADTSVFGAARAAAQNRAAEVMGDLKLNQAKVSDAIRQRLAADKDARNFEQRERMIDATRGLKEQDRMDRMEREARPSDAQTKELADYDSVLGSLAEVRRQKPKFDTGPLAGRATTIANKLGIGNADKAAFAASVGENLADYLKSKSGATVSAAERAALLQNVPNVNDNDDVFMAKLDYLEKKINSQKQNFLSALGQQGKKFKDVAPAPMKQMSAMDQQAADWAAAHPEDPRAAAIKARLGL